MMAWGIEVPGGSKPVTVTPDEGTHLHLSQVALGHQPKDNERAVISVEHEDNKWVIGTLVKGRTDHFQLDLVFDREFRLSNSGSTGVFVVGYESFESTLASSDEEDMGTEDDDAKEIKEVKAKMVSKVKDDKKDLKEKEGKDKSKAVADPKAGTKENGKPAKADPVAVAEGKDAKKAAKVAAPSPVKASDDEDDSDDDMDEDSEDEEFEDEDDEDEDEEDDEDEDDDEDEESDEDEDSDDTPAKPVVVGKKRPNPAGETPKSEKKAKVAQETPTPKKDGKGGKKDKSEGKDKSAAKDAATGKDTPTTKKPFTCSECKGKSFVNESALQAHKKAKHS